MIYKFEKEGVNFEIELMQDLDNDKILNEWLSLSISSVKADEWFSIQLNKKDVYHLIGALHLLQKEMN